MNKVLLSTCVLIGMIGAPIAFASPTMAGQSTLSATSSQSSISAKFAPNPRNSKRVNHDYFDEILTDSIVQTGLSTRLRSKRPEQLIGSRVTIGHDSPYRMEGNKVVFSGFNDNYKLAFTSYRQELEQISNAVDITTLPRDEQLAFWFNLHNVAVIEAISKQYPVKTPSRMTVDGFGATLHDAKMLTVAGQVLSLRDIREQIVFNNWRDNPNVIYGFFLGDLGSPSIQPKAYRGSSLKDQLAASGNEFANSLRGYRKGAVSQVYQDAAPYFFPNFETDLLAHLNSLASDEEVKPEIAEYGIKSVAKYETIIADLAGGDSNRGRASIVVNSNVNGPVPSSKPSDIYMDELLMKFVTLKKQGKGKRGEVIIEDAP